MDPGIGGSGHRWIGASIDPYIDRQRASDVVCIESRCANHPMRRFVDAEINRCRDLSMRGSIDAGLGYSAPMPR